MQRHHLLPRQAINSPGLAAMFDRLGHGEIGFEDFRANGMLLPSSIGAAMRSGLPLHRGPHRRYNEVVLERVGTIEAGWQLASAKSDFQARHEALMRLGLLRAALRRQLMQREHRSLFLNRKDPFRAGVDFSHLDAMADVLWSATSPTTDFQAAFSK